MSFPSRGVLLWRGLTRRCPWCGDRKAYFTGWFSRQPNCRRCGHGFRRGDEAFELGAVIANMALSLVAVLVAILVAVVATAPDVPVMPVTASIITIGLVVPIVLYPVSFTLWQAVDLWMRRPTDAEIDDPRTDP